MAAQPEKHQTLAEFLETRLKQTHGKDGKTVKLKELCAIDSDPLAARIFREYGAIFTGIDVTIPPKCIFESEEELSGFQSTIETRTETIGGTKIELQKAAMDALLAARKQAESRGLNITPRGGSTASKRSFADTQRLWDSRFLPGLDYWITKGKITPKEAEAAKKLPIYKQVKLVLEWETKGIYFSTGRDRTILSSVAAPGTSQHLSALALDVTQFENAAVREILNKYGWFQTVADDTPHFTYIGVAESELPQRGLILTVKNGYKFWIPYVKLM
ncbi:MAG: hypothetical protein DMF62_02000 [Acidobacteria bacterium]|nr:MAG: hypothetical protein DMF62_02000 [Acidobacteriota bacterium]